MAWKNLFYRQQDIKAKKNIAVPEWATPLPDLIIGGKSPQKLEKALNDGKFGVTESAENMLRSPNFTTSPKKQAIRLIKVTCTDMNLPDSTIDEIFVRAKELGFSLCPAEVGPHLRLVNDNSQWLFIGMEPIVLSTDKPNIFRLTEGNSTYNHAWLDAYSLISPDHKLQARDKWMFVFALS